MDPSHEPKSIGNESSNLESQKTVRLQESSGHDSPTLGGRVGTSSSRGGAPGGTGLLRRMTTNLGQLATPEKKITNVPNYTQSFKNAFLSSYINILLVFIPISWATHFVGISDTLIFVFSFLAIIPLASLLSFATEELALRVGQTLGGLLNATLGNAVELIVAILALIKCELQIVQSSLVGSILSNMLLVLGMCFFVGGTKYAEQQVMSMSAQVNASLLQMAVIAILIPGAFNFAFQGGNINGNLTAADEHKEILAMSHGVAIILLVIYIAYLVFQLWSHAHLYVDHPVSHSTQYPDSLKDGVRKVARFGRKDHTNDPKIETNHGENENFTARAWHKVHKPKASSVDANSPVNSSSPTTVTDNAASSQAALTQTQTVTEEESSEPEEEEEEPQLNMAVTIMLLVGTTVIVGVTAEWLVSSINGLTAANPSLSQEWVGLILLPIVGNAAEHVTAVTVARKDKLDLSMGVAIGSSIQIALFVIPFLVLLAWWIGKPLTMLFDPFESIVLFLSVLIVNSTLSDSRSNWLEGWLLMSVYMMVAVAFWYYPGTTPILDCN